MTKKREGIKKKEPKSNILFDVLNDIKQSKKGTLLDENDDKSVSNFMLLKFLSMDHSVNLEISDILNQYQGILDKKQLYKLLVKVIPKQQSFDKFISNKTTYSAYAAPVSSYFQVSKREAQSYIDSKGEEWAKEIQQKFGGKI